MFPEHMMIQWHAMPDDTIGGWCIMASETPPSQGGLEIACFISPEFATHIAALHNAWLDQCERDGAQL